MGVLLMPRKFPGGGAPTRGGEAAAAEATVVDVGVSGMDV